MTQQKMRMNRANIDRGALGHLHLTEAQALLRPTMLRSRPLAAIFSGEKRPMDQDMIATHLKKLDRRLAKVEQILPTLATKDELKALATKEELRAAIMPLATKEELQAAIAPLATKDDLKALAAATKDDLGELRRYMDVLTESLRGDIHLIAAHVASERSKHTGT